MTYINSYRLKNYIGAVIGAVTIALFMFLQPRAQANETIITGQACVIDGDSLLIGGRRDKNDRCRAGHVEIRIIGIDAMEWDQTCGEMGKEWRCGEAASLAMREIAEGKDVICRPKAIDVYKRSVAVCTVNGINVGREIVRLGLAPVSSAYKEDRNAAKAAKIGVWSGPFIKPAAFRKKKKKLKRHRN